MLCDGISCLDRVLHYLPRQVKFYSLSFHVIGIKRLFQHNKQQQKTKNIILEGVGEGTLLWATPCLGPSRFFLNEKKINIFCLMHIALFLSDL